MSEMVEVAVFGSRLEAETIGHALDQADIPFVVQSHDIGMFGPGMIGFTPGGASLRVPSERLEEVRRLLDCVVRPPDDEDLPEELRDEPGDRDGSV